MTSDNTAKSASMGRQGRRAALAWFSAAALEGGAVFLAMSCLAGEGGPAGWAVAVACHLVAAMVLLVMGVGRSRPAKPVSKAQYRARLYGVLVLFLPGMGLAGSLILHLACDRWIRARGLVEDFQAETEHRVIEARPMDTQKDLDAYFDEELAVQPVMDILAGFDDNLKRGAIDTLRRIGTPEAINILKKCLTDASPEVRYGAHTALTRLDETYVKGIKAAKRPLDAPRPAAGHYLHYARQCAGYGMSGLLDDDTRHYYLQMAREAFLAARNAGMTDTLLDLDLGRLGILLGDLEDAAIHFQSILNRDPGNINALLGLAEVHYTRNDAEGLQTIAQRMNAALTADTASVNDSILLHFWASDRQEA